MRLLEQFGASEWVRGFRPVNCGNETCSRWLTERQLSVRRVGVSMGATWWCSFRCVRTSLESQLSRLFSPRHHRTQAAARTSFGLTLLRQGLLTDSQYRTTLDVQRSAGEEIGELVVRLGFMSEQAVTECRALHWACPIFPSAPSACGEMIRIPFRLRRDYSMVPLYHLASGNKLFVGFQYSVEYAPLFAIEQISGCKTQPCFISPSEFLAADCLAEQVIANAEQSFEDLNTVAEMTQIICEIGRATDAERIAIARCGDRLWCRLNQGAKTTDILFRVAGSSSISQFRKM